MKQKILVVDDDLGTVTLLASRLEAAGYIVLKGYNGQEALAVVKQEAPDLIILDRMMPKMDGLKTCALLKSDTRFLKTPVIMLTASAEKSDQDLSIEVGADAFINKPVNIPELIHKIQELISRK
ncbi:MAG: response regulator [Candidatus Omnitrophica bacterium]|nr:response regulator [Candidatus Omnitrophota bacterium]